MPNRRDWHQFKGMVKWFFGKGEMPQFDRWTYWEKFDFLAVFWGMFIIGGSGITLWAPEAASYIYPGWVFNIASIVHSEKPSRRIVYLTVHFFNTPDPTKFRWTHTSLPQAEDGRIETVQELNMTGWKRKKARRTEGGIPRITLKIIAPCSVMQASGRLIFTLILFGRSQ
jgi:cytochrome b subunit of formate dehydrogenase